MMRPQAFVTVIPAAGRGTRLPGRSLSKEITPYVDSGGAERPLIAHLLDAAAQGGADKAIVVLRHDKQDIVDALGTDGGDGHRITYRWTEGTRGVPHTIALGLADVDEENVLFGFPDILFEPSDAFVRMQRRLTPGPAHLVLGLFPTSNPKKMDMVEVDDDGRVRTIDIKPQQSQFELTWILAAWNAAFSRYLCRCVAEDNDRLIELAGREDDLHLGHVFQLAIADGIRIEGVTFPEGRLLDVGTPDDLGKASRWFAQS